VIHVHCPTSCIINEHGASQLRYPIAHHTKEQTRLCLTWVKCVVMLKVMTSFGRDLCWPSRRTLETGGSRHVAAWPSSQKQVRVCLSNRHMYFAFCSCGVDDLSYCFSATDCIIASDRPPCMLDNVYSAGIAITARHCVVWEDDRIHPARLCILGHDAIQVREANSKCINGQQH
jgi:hypothetical protein